MWKPMPPPATDGDATEALLLFFKAMADATRLKIVGLLAQGPLSVEQMAEMLGLRPSTISHHLMQLSLAGLVSARAESYYNIYQLETETLDKMSRKMAERETLKQAAVDVDLDAYDRKVIAHFTDEKGHIKTIPAQRKKLEAILQYLLKEFTPGGLYTEKQVNEILGRYHEDTATLRRELIGYGWLKREAGSGSYWRPEA